MKKTIIFLICIFVLIVASTYAYYQSRQSEKLAINRFNYQYEKFLNKDLQVTDVVTLINKAIDDNTKIQTNESEKGNQNQLEIVFKFQDVDKTYKMGDLISASLDGFRNSFEYSTFRISECIYNKGTTRIEKILIEEINYGNI